MLNFVMKRRKGKIIGTLGEDSGKYNFQVKYTPPLWVFENEVILLDGWGGMDDEVNLKVKIQNN